MSQLNPVNSPARNLADNLDALHQAGHGYLDIPAQVALASSDQSQNIVLSIADKIKSIVSSNKASVESFFNDAQQARQPSVTQQVTSYLHGAVGTNVTTENHVLKIQQDMIKAGKAPGLVANGVWDPAWTNAAFNAQSENFQKPTAGNAPAKSTVQHILSALGETHNVNFLIGIVKAMPREILNLMGDAVVNTSNNLTFQDPINPKTNPTVAKIGQAIAQAGAKPENRTSSKEFVKTASSPSQTFQDAMTLLTFLPMARLATGLKEAGTIAKSGKVLTAAEVQPKYTLLNSIVSSAQKGEIGLIQPSARAILNKPVLNQIYKVGAIGISKTAPTQIAIRNTLAQRLRLPIVRAANKAGLSILGAGLAEQGIALAESKTGGRQGTLDSTVYGLAPISGILANALDIFSIQMNPGNIAGTRAIVGNTAKAAEQLRQAFDDTGVLRAWQRANPEINYSALVADHVASGGSESDVLTSIGHQVNQIAVGHAVDELKNALILDGSWAKMNPSETEDWTNLYSNMIWKDSKGPQSALSLARQTLVIDQNALETGFRNIGSIAMQDTKAVRVGRKGTSNFGKYIQANKLMNFLLQPEYARYFIHPGTLNEFKVQVASQADASNLAQSDFALGIGNGELPSVVKPKLNSNFVEMNNPAMPDGAAGLATIDKLTSSGAKKLYNKFAEQLGKADTPELKAQVRTDIANSLIQEFGVNVFKLGDYDSQDLLNLLELESKKLAGDLHIVRDAPQEFKDALEQLKNLGYKPIYGTDIGHIFTKSAQYTDLGASGFSKEAAVARKLGISPRLSDSSALSARTKVETDREVQARIDSGKIEVLPGFNASRVIAYLRNALPKEAKLTVGQEAVLYASKAHGNYEIPINRLMELNKSDSKFTREQAWAQIKQSKIGEMGLREIDHRVIIKILTAPIPKDVASMMGLDKEIVIKPTVLPKGLKFEYSSAGNSLKTKMLLQKEYGINKQQANQALDAHTIIAKDKNGNYIGHISWNKDTGKIQLVNVSSEMQRKGIATELFNQAREIKGNVVKPIHETVAGNLSPEGIAWKKAIESEKLIYKDVPFMSKESAQQFVQALWKARVNVPLEMIGGPAKLEDILYAGLGIGNVKWLGKSAMNIAAAPAYFMNLRTRVRYQESIVFAFRRMFKTMAKGITENIPPVMYPESKMEEMGITDAATAIHALIFPEDSIRISFMDDAERITNQADFYNLYNPIASKQWATYWLAKNAIESSKLATTKLPNGLKFSVKSSKPGGMENLIGPTHEIYVLNKDGKKIANLSWSKNTKEIGDLYVSKEYRRQGLATAMFDEGVKLFSKKGEEPTHSKILTQEGKKWIESVSTRKFEMGLTNEMKAEIAKKVENVMGYGERTAAERSLNAIFFPFSFNKTVMRQFGGFLLSHPGQALVINSIIDLYDQIDGPKYRKWVEDNLPLIKQAEALNAISHGVGLGQFGGINAPYYSGLKSLFTILGPKTINYGSAAQQDATMSNLKKYIPMVKEFSDLFLGPQTPGHMFEGQIESTAKTVLGVADNIKERVTGNYVPETVFHPYRHNMMPIAAQQTAAWDYRTQLITGLTKVLDYNYKNPNNRAVWPDWVPVEIGIQGKAITKSSIGQLVHYKYPAWDNAASAVISQRKTTEADSFIGQVTARNPTLGATYRQFEDYAKKVSDAVNKDSIQAPKLAQITDIFRGIAIDLANKDSNFAEFYKTHYQRLFGPLEAFK